ncbi:unnamed protein product [Sphagnum jensenii]
MQQRSELKGRKVSSLHQGRIVAQLKKRKKKKKKVLHCFTNHGDAATAQSGRCMKHIPSQIFFEQCYELSTGHQLRFSLQLMCTRLESMLSTFTSVVRNFRLSLPNHYDPDQIAAYCDHSPTCSHLPAP